MKRMFLGFTIEAPWPEHLPQGRLIPEESRHLTFLFLGEQDENKILSLLEHLPTYPLPLGLAGYFDHCLFLPVREPRVAAWYASLGDEEESLRQWVRELQQRFAKEGIFFNHGNDWLPHATIARAPFSQEEWKNHFLPLPFMATSFHLFESTGHLQYTSLWKYNLTPPLEKISHTADIAYKVRGVDFRALYRHAQLALAFEHPMLLAYTEEKALQSIEEVIRALNRLISTADLNEGSPFKAVSYHGQAIPRQNFLEWEMIVDV